MTSLDDSLGAELERLKESGNLRCLRQIDKARGPHVEIDGKWLLSFASNDYLGLASHQKLWEAHVKGLKWGSGSTGSRLMSGNLSIHQQLEDDIAKFKQSESAIVFATGYAANVGTIQSVVGRGDLILSDELNHASIIDGCRLSYAETRVYRHNDIGDARLLLTDRTDFRRVLIVTDSVFSMDGDLAPLPELVDLAEENDAWLMVDDAHGTGVYGQTGSGVVEHFGLRGRVPIQLGTMSKAIGCSGGFVVGSRILIDWLRNTARSFMFSTAPSPSNSEAVRSAIKIIQTQPELRNRLIENIRQMRSGLQGLGLTIPAGESAIIPVIIGSSEVTVRISKEIENQGIWIPAVRPPTVPHGSSRLRITVTAGHTEEEIDRAISAIEASTL